MKLIDKHLLREYLVPLLYCLTGFVMLYLILALFEYAPRLADAGLSLSDQLRFYGHYLVGYTDSANISFIVIVLPVSLLAGTLYSLFQLSRQNELTAMRASGVSLYRLMAPFLMVGVICSIVAICVQEIAAPKASLEVDRIRSAWRQNHAVNSVIENHKYYNPGAHRRWNIEKFATEDPSFFENVEIIIERPDTTRKKRITAEKAEYAGGHWWLYGVTEQKYKPDDAPDGPPGSWVEGPIEMKLFTERPEQFVIEADIRRITRYSSAVSYLRHLSNQDGVPASELANKRVDAHLRLAMPWACIVVALMGIPAGARGGRQSAVTAVMSAVVLFLAFYILMQVGLVIGKKGIIFPWLGAWLPNIVFFAVGWVMILRMR